MSKMHTGLVRWMGTALVWSLFACFANKFLAKYFVPISCFGTRGMMMMMMMIQRLRRGIVQKTNRQMVCLDHSICSPPIYVELSNQHRALTMNYV